MGLGAPYQGNEINFVLLSSVKFDLLYFEKQVYKLPGEKIYATYFGGDEELGLKDADEEAKKEWLKVLPASRVLPCEVWTLRSYLLIMHDFVHLAIYIYVPVSL